MRPADGLFWRAASAGLFGLAACLCFLALHLLLGPLLPRGLLAPVAFMVGLAGGAGLLLGPRLVRDACVCGGAPARGFVAGVAVTACAVAGFVVVRALGSVAHDAAVGGVLWALGQAVEDAVLLGGIGLLVTGPFGGLAGMALYWLAADRRGRAA